MPFLLLEDGSRLLQEDGGGILLDFPATVHEASLSFRSGAGASATGYIARRRGARWFGLARIFLDDATENLSTAKITHPSRVYTARIEDWGEISKSLPVPSGMPEASRLRIRLIDTDRNYRDVFGGQTPQGRTVQLKWMQEGTSEAAADIHFTGEVETFEKGPGYLDVEAIGRMLSWLDERFLDLITQANFPEFPDVKTAFLPVIIGHVQGRAVSLGLSPGAVAEQAAGALVDASDAATVIKDQILAAVFATGPFEGFTVASDWLIKVETPYGQGIALIINEFNLQAAAGVLEFADAEYARTALQDLLDATDTRATEFAAMGGSRATVIANFRSGVTSFFGEDWANMLAAVDATIASLGEDPPEELFAPQGAIPLPHIGFLEGVGDRWGASMHPLWNVLAIYRKLPDEAVFAGVDFAEYNVTIEDREFGEIPGRTFTCTFIDFLVEQPDGTEIHMDADGAYDRAAFGALPAVGYSADGRKGPLQNPVDGFLILKDHLFHKAGVAASWDITALAALRAKFETGGTTIPPLFMDRATLESMTCRERIAQFNASFQTSFLDTNRGLYTLVRIDDSFEDRPVLTESHIISRSFHERSPQTTVNRFIAKYSPDYTHGDAWFDTAIADNLADQAARGKLQDQTVLLWDVRNAQTAQAAVSDRLRYTSLRSFIQTLTAHISTVSAFLELARLIGITHSDGMQISGYVNREVQIVNIRASFKTRQAVIESIVRAPAPFEENELIMSACPTDEGTADTEYPEYLFTASGGLAPYLWTATGLPAGMTLSPGGVLSGTPTEDGTFSWTPTVTDSLGNVVAGACELIINVSYARPTQYTEDPEPQDIDVNTTRVRKDGDPAAAFDGDQDSFFSLDITGGTGVSVFGMEHFHDFQPPPNPDLTLLGVRFFVRMRQTVNDNYPNAIYAEVFDGIDTNPLHHTPSPAIVGIFALTNGATTDWVDYGSDVVPAATFNAMASPTVRLSPQHTSGELSEPFPRFDFGDIKMAYIYE